MIKLRLGWSVSVVGCRSVGYLPNPRRFSRSAVGYLLQDGRCSNGAAPCTMKRFLVLALAASAAAAPTPPIQSRAWAALLTGNSENMTTLALVQMASLRRFSAHKTQ